MTIEKYSDYFYHTDKKEILDAKQHKVNFCLYCEPNNMLTQEEHDRRWAMAAQTTPSGQKVELQYEPVLETQYWRSLPQMLMGKVDGVHAPTKGRDIAGLNDQLRTWSVRETEGAMDMANELKANYFVVHLTPQDDFCDRNSQLERGMRSLEDLAEYRRKKGYTTKILLETLEYPKWPADIDETISVVGDVKKFIPDLGFCLDVGHLWHNLNSLLPSRKPFDFKKELDSYIKKTSRYVGIDVVHLVGAYVEKENGNEIHATHAIPGLSPRNGFSVDSKMYYKDAPPDFKGDWMNIDTVLSSIKKYAGDTGKFPTITVEAHEPDINLQILACRNISEQIFVI